MHAFKRLSTFDLIIEQSVCLFLSVCHGVFHFCFLTLLLNSSTHHIFSTLTPPFCLLHTTDPSSSLKTLPTHPVYTPINTPPSLPPTDRALICLYTREGDVESLQRYGEVRNEA